MLAEAKSVARLSGLASWTKNWNCRWARPRAGESWRNASSTAGGVADGLPCCPLLGDLKPFVVPHHLCISSAKPCPLASHEPATEATPSTKWSTCLCGQRWAPQKTKHWAGKPALLIWSQGFQGSGLHRLRWLKPDLVELQCGHLALLRPVCSRILLVVLDGASWTLRKLRASCNDEGPCWYDLRCRRSTYRTQAQNPSKTESWGTPQSL